MVIIMRVSCPSCGNHVHFDKQLEIPMSESRIVQACENCQSDIFLLAKFGIQPTDPLYQDPEWLFSAYITQNRTLADIAKECGVSSMTVQYWLRQHNIPSRSRGRKAQP